MLEEGLGVRRAQGEEDVMEVKRGGHGDPGTRGCSAADERPRAVSSSQVLAPHSQPREWGAGQRLEVCPPPTRTLMVKKKKVSVKWKNGYRGQLGRGRSKAESGANN